MPRRSDARKCALQMLYLVDQNPDADIKWIRRSVEERCDNDEALTDFTWRLITGVREQRLELDEQIAGAASNWRIDRMAPTDRNVIRLGLYEMKQVQTPVAVVLDECVELAKEFGGENSPSFVNGVLDKLSQQDTQAPG